MINFKSTLRRPSKLKHTIGAFLVLFLSACGGGLGGSGDGGSVGKLDGPAVPLPNYFETPYEFREIPEQFMARFPGSLASNKNSDSPESAYRVLTNTVSDLIDKKLEIALLTLLVQANWEAISEHCSTTADDTDCDLSTRPFSATYTNAMAAWEYLLRASIELERTGRTEVYGASLRTIEIIVNRKIDTNLTIDSGMLTQMSSGSHRYEFTTTTDLGFGNSVYTARWSEDQLLTYISITELSTNGVNSLQSSYTAKNGTSSFNNSILSTSAENDADIHSERQLNLNQLTAMDTLEIEAQQTDIRNSIREDYYSIGNASTTGGYLKSEQVSEDETDTTMSTFFRETFNGFAAQESNAICRMSESEAQCDLEDKWEIRTPQDPIFSQFFLTPNELSEIESQLKPFNVQFEDISDSVDVLVLLPRENLTVSVTADGIILELPGLGIIDLTTNAITPVEPNETIGSTNDVFDEYTPTILCRANRAIIDDVNSFRTFCAGSVEDIEDALVVGESFTEGKLVIEWQANANIIVIDQ